MPDHPLILVLFIAAAAGIGKWWLEDLGAARAGRPAVHALPGATLASLPAVGIGVAGALGLLGVETVGESAFRLTAEQSHVTVLFGLYSLAAAPVEEIVFRGYVVVERHGAAIRGLGIVGASLLFALFHPFLWRWESGGLEMVVTTKSVFSTAAVFATSLWLYVARFGPWNPSRSLLPCIAAHLARNAGVLAIKAAQGFVSGPW